MSWCPAASLQFTYCTQPLNLQCAVHAECVGTQSEQAGKAASCAGCPNQVRFFFGFDRGLSQENFAELSAVLKTAPLVSRGWRPVSWQWCSVRQACSVRAYVPTTSEPHKCPPVKHSRHVPDMRHCGAPSTPGASMPLFRRSAPAALRSAFLIISVVVAKKKPPWSAGRRRARRCPRARTQTWRLFTVCASLLLRNPNRKNLRNPAPRAGGMRVGA